MPAGGLQNILCRGPLECVSTYLDSLAHRRISQCRLKCGARLVVSRARVFPVAKPTALKDMLPDLLRPACSFWSFAETFAARLPGGRVGK